MHHLRIGLLVQRTAMIDNHPKPTCTYGVSESITAIPRRQICLAISEFEYQLADVLLVAALGIKLVRFLVRTNEFVCVGPRANHVGVGQDIDGRNQAKDVPLVYLASRRRHFDAQWLESGQKP